MKATVSKGRTLKRVRVAEIGHATHDEIVEFALKKANETRASLFGIRVLPSISSNDEPIAYVELYTD